jgi:hypothetical protein
MRKLLLIILCTTLFPLAAFADGTETICNDRIDNDGDTVTDCADADCFKTDACKAGGSHEQGDAHCSDWIDNDADGAVDCNDMDCNGTQVCRGSWRDPNESGGGQNSGSSDIPELPAGSTVADLIGTGGDLDGERNDMLCSDGIDNDGDGQIDCADFGCRFDPEINVCRSNPGMRFSVVGSVGNEYDLETKQNDTRFDKLQLRSFGPIPGVQNSFYLLSMRAEKTPRLTFALFQMPLFGGHTINVNSGGGGLSNALVLSSSKLLLLDSAYYMSNAFEQGNGAAVEIAGPITADNKIRYRVFGAGGSGRFAGNVGGRYFTYNNDNYTWATGAQIHMNLIGFWSRWDSPFMMTPVATTLAVTLGAKYDQRAQERYPAAHASALFRTGRVHFKGEFYFKKELEFESTQMAYNVEAGFLVMPNRIMLAADFGQFLGGEMENPPDQLETDLKKQRDEMQWRVAAHIYFWRTIGRFSFIYTDRTLTGLNTGDPDIHEQKAGVFGQYRF